MNEPNSTSRRCCNKLSGAAGAKERSIARKPSICFLVSGAIAYRASPRHGLRPAGGSPGWWQAGVNLLGCVFFGVSAVAGYVVPASGSVIDQAAATWTTSAGAACFLACAVGALRSAALAAVAMAMLSLLPDRREAAS